MNRHKTTTRAPSVPLTHCWGPRSRGVATRHRKVVGQGFQRPPQSASAWVPPGNRRGPWVGPRLSHSSTEPGEGEQWRDEPKGGMGGTGATAGAGTLYPGTGAQALSRGWSGKFKGRKLRQSQPSWNLGQVAESMGSSTPILGFSPSPATSCSVILRHSLPGPQFSHLLNGDNPILHQF